VGIQTSRDGDEPFWPAENCYNFKEIWVHPSSRWLAILADLEAVARIGREDPPRVSPGEG